MIPGRANGLFEQWIAEGLEARLEGLNWQGAYGEYGINTIFLENLLERRRAAAQERYFGHFVVSTQRIGCQDGRDARPSSSASRSHSVERKRALTPCRGRERLAAT